VTAGWAETVGLGYDGVNDEHCGVPSELGTTSGLTIESLILSLQMLHPELQGCILGDESI